MPFTSDSSNYKGKGPTPGFVPDAQVSGKTQKRKRSFLENVGGVADAVFGGGGVGEYIGTEAARGTFGKPVQRILTGRNMTEEDEAGVGAGPSVGRIAGSALRSAALFVPVGRVASALTPTIGRIGGNVAAGALAGYATDVGRNLEEGKENVAMPGLGTAVGAGLPTAQALIRGVGSVLTGTGNKILTGNIKPSRVDYEDGFDLMTLKKYKVQGTLQDMLDQTQSEISTRMRQLEQVVQQNPTKVNLTAVINKTAEQLGTKRISGFGSNKQLNNALINLADEVKLLTDDGTVSLADAQKIKQAAGHFGAWKWNTPDPESKAAERVYNTFYNVIKKDLENQGGTTVRELNKQMSELIPVANALIRRVPVASRNQALSLSDMLVLTGATFNPSASLLALINIAQRSAAVGGGVRDAGAALSRFGSKASRSGEAVGRGLLNVINAPQTPSI